MDVNAKLHRYNLGQQQTLGTLSFNNKSFDTLELPWKDNARRISCIPPGTYKVIKRNSKKYGNHFWVQGVEGRDMILIHAGNFYTQTQGCILVGTGLRDLNGDGLKDVMSSNITMQALYAVLPDSFTLTITQ